MGLRANHDRRFQAFVILTAPRFALTALRRQVPHSHLLHPKICATPCIVSIGQFAIRNARSDRGLVVRLPKTPG